MQLGSANVSHMNTLSLIRLDLTLGSHIRTVVPSLGPDVIHIDNSFLLSFQEILDWEAQTLALKASS